MRKIRTLLPLIFIIIMVVLWVYLLNAHQDYCFYNREQQQIFIYDYHSLYDRYFSFGGLSLLISQFLVQFFFLHFAAPIITAVIGGIATGLMWHSFRRLSPEIGRVYLVPFCFMPIILQLNALSDPHYNYEGFIAFVLMISTFACYTRLSGNKTVVCRVAIGSVLAFVLYILAGSVAIPFAVSVFLYDLLTKRKYAFLQLIILGLVLITGFLFVRLGIIASTRLAFTNDFYYEPLLRPRFGLIMSWISFVMLIPIIWLTHFFGRCWETVWGVCPLLLFIFNAGYTVYLLSANRNSRLSVLFRMQRDVETQNWDDILESYSTLQDKNNYLLMNYVNLALSYKRELMTNLLYYHQQDPFSLIVGGNPGGIPEVVTLLSYIYYRMGNISAAQDKAFDSFVICPYGNPSMLKMLVKTNLIYRNYTVAEKYISILEKTCHYRGWALRQRRFLYNDNAVSSDNELGDKQRGLPHNDHFTMNVDPYEDLAEVLNVNPNDVATRDYAMAYLLLSKNKDQMDRFVQRYYGTPVLRRVPELFQEAVVALHENNLDYCLQHGVTEKTIRNYQTFKNIYLQAQHTGEDPETLLKADFGQSYWYYILLGAS
ncbi:MAG: DUF6057 family protein [Prevotella sp.]|nr:DUF6057 family protein [Prevotella sp.]